MSGRTDFPKGLVFLGAAFGIGAAAYKIFQQFKKSQDHESQEVRKFTLLYKREFEAVATILKTESDGQAIELFKQHTMQAICGLVVKTMSAEYKEIIVASRAERRELERGDIEKYTSCVDACTLRVAELLAKHQELVLTELRVCEQTYYDSFDHLVTQGVNLAALMANGLKRELMPGLKPLKGAKVKEILNLALEQLRLVSNTSGKTNVCLQECLIEDKVFEVYGTELEVAEIQAETSKDEETKALVESIQSYRLKIEQNSQISGLSSFFSDNNRLRRALINKRS